MADSATSAFTSSSRPNDDSERTLYIGNLHENVTDDLLYELFLQAGPLQGPVKTVKVEGKSPFAFVLYQHEESVPYAIALLNGIRLFDKALQVKARSGTQQAKRIDEAYKKQREQTFQEERAGRRRFEDQPNASTPSMVPFQDPFAPFPDPFAPSIPMAIVGAPHFMQFAGVGDLFGGSPNFLPPPPPPPMSPMAMGGRHADLRDTGGGYSYQHYENYRRDESGDRTGRRNKHEYDSRGRDEDRYRTENDRGRGYYRRPNVNNRYDDKHYDYDDPSGRNRYERR